MTHLTQAAQVTVRTAALFPKRGTRLLCPLLQSIGSLIGAEMSHFHPGA